MATHITAASFDEAINEVIDSINNMSTSELVFLNNEYCDEMSWDDTIYKLDEDTINMFFKSPFEALQCVTDNFNVNDDYCKFDGYGNLESFDYMKPSDLPERVDVMAEQIVTEQFRCSMFIIDIYEETEEETDETEQ